MRSAASRAIVLAGLLGATAACKSAPPPPSPPPAAQVTEWRRLGSWSGRGNLQSESFESSTGSLRVRWHASGGAANPPGTLRLTAHSAISGRPLEMVVDHRGPGEGTAYVNQDPHVFYMEVDSANLDWSFTVEEGIR
jgi:hypothetical protein